MPIPLQRDNDPSTTAKQLPMPSSSRPGPSVSKAKAAPFFQPRPSKLTATLRGQGYITHIPKVMPKPSTSKAAHVCASRQMVIYTPPVPKQAPPPPPKQEPWYIALRDGLKSLSHLSSDDEKLRCLAAMMFPTDYLFHPPPEFMRRDLQIAALWKMRFSQDNICMAGFQLQSLITMALGMPFLVPFCDPSMSYFLLTTITLYVLASVILCHKVIVFDRPDLPVPYWRSYLRDLLGVRVLHIYVACPSRPGDHIEDHDFDWHQTLGFKDSYVTRHLL